MISAPTTSQADATPQAAQPLGRWLRVTLWMVALAAFGYLAVSLYLDADTVLAGLAAMGWGGWLAVLGLSLLNYALRALRWVGYLVRLRQPSLPLVLHFAVYLAGFVFTLTPGKAGEVLRSSLLKAKGVSWHASLAALFVERLADLLVMACLSLLCLGLMENGAYWIGAGAMLPAAVMVFLWRSLARRIVLLAARRLPHGRLRRLCLLIARMLRNSRSLLQPLPLLAGFGVGLVAWGGEAVGLYLILTILAPELAGNVGLPLIAGIYALSMLIGGLAFLPGGLGGTEAAMAFLLNIAGFELDVALMATMICRMATLWFAVALGGVALPLALRQMGAGNASLPTLPAAPAASK